MNRKRPGNFWTKFGNSEHSVTGEPLHTYTHTERRTVARTLAFIFRISFSFSLTTTTNICRTVPQQGGPVWWIPTTYSKLQRPLYGCKITGWFLECVKKGKLLDFDNGGLFLFSATFLTRFAQPHPKNLWNCMMSNCVLSGFR